MSVVSEINDHGGELYRATYRFIGTDTHTISLTAGLVYCVIETTTVEWWLVSDDKGRIGYVPGNYLQEYIGRDTTLALRYVEIGLGALYKQTSSHPPTVETRALIRKLTTLRDKITSWGDDSSVSEFSTRPYIPQRSESMSERKRRAPPPPIRKGSMDPILRPKPDQVVYIKTMAPPPPSQPPVIAKIIETTTDVSSTETESELDEPTVRQVSQLSFHSEPDISATLDTIEIPFDIGSSLARIVKNHSQLSSQKSRDLLRGVLCHLGSSIPVLDRLMDKIMTEFLADVKFARDQETEAEMRALFKRLETYKDDMQQITNPIQNDLEEIVALLQELNKQVNDAHRETTLAVIEHDNYSTLMVLVNYYQVEARKEIRFEILRIFAYLFAMSDVINRQLTPTVVTVELARDLRDMLANPETDRSYLAVLILTFTELLSVLEPLTVFAQEHLTEDWLLIILEYIDNDSVEKGEDINNLLVNLVLAFNLHFDDVSYNTVMNVIAVKSSWTNFSERLMILTNRGEDPLAVIYYESGSCQPPHSVLKILQDLYSMQSTSTFFYTSDQNILIEIILRNLLDLPSDSVLRTEYLQLLQLLVKNSTWYEDRHKAVQLKSIVASFAKEDAPLQPDSTSFKNRKVAKTIIDEFNQHFTT